MPTAQNASRDPVGLFAEDDLLPGARTLPPRDPFAASGVVQASTPGPPPPVREVGMLARSRVAD